MISYQQLTLEMEMLLQEDVLAVWFPRSIEDHTGGFYSNSLSSAIGFALLRA